MDSLSIERFLIFLEMKSHTSEEVANQVLLYLRQVYKLNFSKCKSQSYDITANMFWRYKGMQENFLETNTFAIYMPCAAHSLVSHVLQNEDVNLKTCTDLHGTVIR